MPNRPKQLIGEKQNVVQDCIVGLCHSNSNLTYLDGFPEIKVVVNAEFDRQRVAVISGGGAGHEPAFGGYVGDGMLAAAVVGDVFSSPPTEAVLAAIEQVTGDAGCLVIVMNYTGDRLNFGLAVEQAKAKGLKVDLLVVGDDCALPGTGLAGRRGISGTVLVAKVAGAAAKLGDSLENVRDIADKASKAVGSMGIATSVCTLPGGTVSDRLGVDEIEVGLGIHGEPGAAKKKIQPVTDIVQEVLETIVEFSKIDESEDELAVLINNLGTVSQLEMGVITGAVTTFLTQKRSFEVVRIYSGTFMTSLDMHGFSISLMRTDSKTTALLDEQCKASGWSNQSNLRFKVRSPIELAHKDGDKVTSRPPQVTEFGQKAEACMTAAVDRLIEEAEKLDEWDRRVGDGDCGTTVARGAREVKNALGKTAPLNDAGLLALCLADSARTMGGTSGALYNILFTAAAGKLPRGGPASGADMSRAISAGVAAIQKYGGASQGYRTMLDALQPAAEAFQNATDSGKSAAEAAHLASEAASKGADRTRTMTAGAGRSSYVPETELAGIPDPGAVAVAIWMQAASEAFASSG